jgi:hypothetical protein
MMFGPVGGRNFFPTTRRVYSKAGISLTMANGGRPRGRSKTPAKGSKPSSGWPAKCGSAGRRASKSSALAAIPTLSKFRIASRTWRVKGFTSSSSRTWLLQSHLIVNVVDPGFGTILAAGDPFEWPLGRGADRRERDLRRIPSASSEEREFVYLSGLPAGWCGIDDVEAGTTLRLRFDIRDLPYLWLFLSYGGWRDCYTAVLEPCTNMPKDLAQAVRAGRSAYLPPHAVFQTSLFVTLGARPSGEEARA